MLARIADAMFRPCSQNVYYTKRLGQKCISLAAPMLVKYIHDNTGWLEMLVVSALALAAGPPAKTYRFD